ncbi:MAG: acyl-CoA/acyl-ACP dehydrogenase, partial [Actinomycetota bacterium]|nr:acyl-CoA/acyl-ACP dehydrogenase [Actinomycetota bacterium]
MGLHERLEPVLKVARESAAQADADAAFPTTSVTALRDSGLLGLTLPEEVGGLGAGPHELVATISALAGACGSTAMIYLMHVSASMTVAAAPPPGAPDLLSRLASGESLATLAFSEPGSRSHFWAPVSKSRRNDAGVLLDARKSWVTSAGQAELYVTSTLNPDADTVDLYAISASTPGVAVSGDWHGLG